MHWYYERRQLCLLIIKKPDQSKKCPLPFMKCEEEGGNKVWNIVEERPKEVKKCKCKGPRELVTDPNALPAPSQFWVPQEQSGGESSGEGCLKFTMEVATPGPRYTTGTRLCSEQGPGKRIWAWQCHSRRGWAASLLLGVVKGRVSEEKHSWCMPGCQLYLRTPAKM